MVSKVLLCPPTFYRIEYVINPWMNPENQVDPARAQEEFDLLCELYKKIGLENLFIDPQPGLPDMVYAANHGFVINDVFIKSNFRFPQRRKEADFAAEYFKRMGFTVKTLPDDVFFEGQGDMFYRDGIFYSGHGKRTSPRAVSYLQELLGTDIVTYEVNDPYFYHLDTCFAPLGKGRIVINPRSFSRSDYERIKRQFKSVIETTANDNRFLCCNLVAQNGSIIIGKGISKELRRSLEKEGFEVMETPMQEFLKGGGSVKCLTLEFFSS